MIRIIGLVCALVAATGALSVQAEDIAAPDMDAVCAKTACRTGGYHIAVRMDADHYTTIPVTRSPYVTDEGMLIIFPGETLAFQVTLDGDKIKGVVFYKAFAAGFPSQLVKDDDSLGDNPDDATLPRLNGKDTREKLAGLPANVVLLTYGQSGSDVGTLLIMEHNLPGTLKVDAIMAAIVKNQKAYNFKPTSTCPVFSQTAGYESWPFPIGAMMLENLRLLPKGADTACT